MIAREYVESVAAKQMRVDGRAFDAFRPVTIEYGVSAKSAEGSARVTIGDTIVVAGVKLDIGPPFPDKPDEGSLVVNVELIPLSSPQFESGPPSIDAIELARVTDRGIRESHAVDFKKLCVREGEKVWLVFVDIYPINAAGNLFDACALAALAAIRDARFPRLEGDKVDYTKRTSVPLPLTQLPIGVTVWRVGSSLLVDLLPDEEEAANARLTVVFTEDGKICAMQKGLDASFTMDEVFAVVDLAGQKSQELRRLFL